MNIDQAKKKLDRLLESGSNISDSFHLGRVGFRKHTKKYLNSIESSIDKSIEIGRLREFIKLEESKLNYNPKKFKDKFYSNASELIKGEMYNDIDYGAVEVIKINKNTVTIKTLSGYTENRNPNFIYKK